MGYLLQFASGSTDKDLKNVVKNPNIIVGDYTYYDDPIDSEGFEKNVLYHYPFLHDKLKIGKFCVIL